MLNILMSKELFELVFSTFRETIDNRIKKFSQHEIKELGKSNFNISIKTLLVKDLTKYNLGAHTDHIGKLITFLFYLPSNNDLSSIGTALYQPIDKIKEEEMTKHFTHEQTQQRFKKIKACPFVPNSLLIFPRTPVSFHGVEEVNISQKERDLLQLNYYISKGKQNLNEIK